MESPKIIWIGCDGMLTGSASADHNVFACGGGWDNVRTVNGGNDRTRC
jgi:hypothetical protein